MDGHSGNRFSFCSNSSTRSIWVFLGEKHSVISWGFFCRWLSCLILLFFLSFQNKHTNKYMHIYIHLRRWWYRHGLLSFFFTDWMACWKQPLLKIRQKWTNLSLYYETISDIWVLDNSHFIQVNSRLLL